MAKTGRASDPTLEELLTFERLLSDLSARLANVTADRVVAEIEDALNQLIRFLGFDRGTFMEFAEGDSQSYLCSAAVRGIEPRRGAVPDHHSWFIGELRAGRTIVIRSYEEIPREAAASVGYFRRIGIRSQLLIPLFVGGHVVSALGFGARQSARQWPDHFIARVKVIGEVMAQALAQKRSEAALRATQSELARVTRLTAAGQMAAAMAHEINQPLAAIVAAGSAGLRWLLDPTPDHLEEVRAVLKSIVREGNRANQVINGIRAMFKKDSREKTLLDVNQVIRDVLALLYSELRTHQIVIETELVTKLPTVLADRVQLQQVLANLIVNAIEAMNTVDGGVRTLRVKSALGASGGVLIIVADSGPGIAAENADRIFDPFFTTKSQGMGMGLSVSKSIIEAHDGHLSAQPATDRGSVFRIALPAGDP